MSLTDTDKNSDKRGNPQLNQNDQVLHRMANATTSVHPVTDSTTTSGYLQTSNGRILGNDGTNNVGLFGFDDAGNMVVKVAKPGYDANSAANENLIFNSAQNVFKIVASGTATVPAYSQAHSGNNSQSFTTSVTVDHNLGFIPVVIAFANNSSGSFPTEYIPWGGDFISENAQVFNLTSKAGFSVDFGAIASIAHFQTLVSTTQVVFKVYGLVYFGTASDGPWSVKYYLLQETAN